MYRLTPLNPEISYSPLHSHSALPKSCILSVHPMHHPSLAMAYLLTTFSHFSLPFLFPSFYKHSLFAIIFMVHTYCVFIITILARPFSFISLWHLVNARFAPFSSSTGEIHFCNGCGGEQQCHIRCAYLIQHRVFLAHIFERVAPSLTVCFGYQSGPNKTLEIIQRQFSFNHRL